MDPLAAIHFPVRRRWPWWQRRCRCGLPLRQCPDFRRLVYLTRQRQ